MAKSATLDDLQYVDDKAELVGGEIVRMTPGGDQHGRASLRIGSSLLAYEEGARWGRAYGDNVAFIVNLPNRRSFSPDAAYYFGPPAGSSSIARTFRQCRRPVAAAKSLTRNPPCQGGGCLSTTCSAD